MVVKTDLKFRDGLKKKALIAGGVALGIAGLSPLASAKLLLRSNSVEYDAANFVPYTGATSEVNLGTQKLITADVAKTANATLTFTGSQLTQIVKGSTTYTFTFNGDGTLHTKSDGTRTWTYVYSGGNLQSWTVT